MLDMLFTGQAVWFAAPALLGTALFVVKLVLMSLGAGHLGTDLHHDGLSDAHSHDGTDDAFKVLSIQGVLAFLMGFGWAGLAALHGTDWSTPLVLAAAAAAGTAMMYLMATLMHSLLKLQASGNIDIRRAVGAEGEVYVTVPGKAGGSGQVSLVVDGRQRIYNAVTSGDALPSRSRAIVVGVNGDNTVSVEPAGPGG
jgi:hypothetical protein